MATTPVPTFIIDTEDGFELMVDEDVFRKYHHLKWRVTEKGYAVAHEEGRKIFLHREIMGITDANIIVDHKDRDRFNYRRENLRVATITQNNQNRSKFVSSKFPWKGVQKLSGKRRKPYNARITVAGATMSLGYYETPEGAARAYDAKAKELFGEFAALNFPEE